MSVRSHGEPASVPAPIVVDDAERPDEHRRAMELAPQLRADASPRVEAQAEQRREVAGDDAEPREERPVAHREGHEHPRHAGVQPGVAEHGGAMQAIVIRPASAVCSWRRASAGATPRLRTILDAIVSPIATEAVTSSSATTPDARLASHQR